ncbi:MAG: glycoside hydrolase family 3 C-terminal domain-containing protein [Clostridia bacterium]|nr:glycoside hydrolase family 3 C-terminal domain-containing protein [Clostridia bacterium]
MKKRNPWIVPTVLLLVVTAVLGAAIPVTNYYETMINAALNAETQKIVPDPDAQIFFWTEYEDEDALVSHDMETCYRVEAEGAALLLNRDHTLPLPADTKFTLFSQSVADPVMTGTGSAFMATGDAISLYGALEASFAPGCVNTDLWKFYKTAGYKRENAKLSGGSPDQYRINEVPWEKYSDALKATFQNYGDCALVLLSRSSGEGADLPSGLDSLKEYMTDGDYLRLCKEEVELLENLRALKENGTFRKIVVLLNSSSTLQLDFVENYGIDAVLWVGNLGLNGIPAVADILAGKVNPSGRIVDTFLKNNHSMPAMANYDAFPYTNADELGLEAAQNNSDAGIEKCNRNYVVYQEGIYVGYRYYETRYEDYVLGQGNAGDYDYAADVAFPFGTGLSYSTFEYSDFAIADKGDTIEASVTVKNTSAIDGKHTVQIYFQSPYTDYDRLNGVEKASVELCGFDKKEIKAGDSERFTISIRKDDLTSYDANNAKTYILDAGDYRFTVGTDAHNAVNNILAAKGADASRMDAPGDASLCAKWTVAALDTTTYAVSAYTGNAITNQFDDADLNKYAGADGQTVTYLSRADWTGTFPQTNVVLRVTDGMWADGLTHEESGRAAIAERMKAAYYADATVQTFGQDGALNAIDLVETVYDDPAWDALVSEVAYDELLDMIYNGAYNTHALSAINLPATQAGDGPTGYTKSLMGGNSGMAFPSEDVIASSHNRELAAEVGKCIGEDMLHANTGTNASAVAGVYAPGANTHRTPYLGRHNEYYSEDGWLAGEICAAEVQGVRDRGALAYVKHFALNDQEQGRYGVSVFANEQSIREVYLESFEGAVRGGAMNVMTSFNRIGVVWAGSHRGLMTDVLRGEWGMQGATVTDMSMNAKWMDYRLGILAGQDIWCGQKGSMGTLDGSENDPAITNAVQRAAKNVIYSVTRSSAMNIGNATVISVTPAWKTALRIAAIASTALTVCFAALCVIRHRKNKKGEESA